MNRPSILNEDNSSAISLMKYPKSHSRCKHIDIKHHFIRETITNGKIQVIHCPTANMRADMFTKALPIETFERHRTALGLIPKSISVLQEQQNYQSRETVENELARATTTSCSHQAVACGHQATSIKPEADTRVQTQEHKEATPRGI
jgi:hypothetical protein